MTDGELRGWFALAHNTYAVIDAQAVPKLAGMLAEAGLAEWGPLQRGGVAADAAEAWCVELTTQASFTQWLLAGEGAALDDWGTLVFSDLRFRPVREHLRGLLEVQLPRRERVGLQWYRPAVMRALLPLCSPPQLAEFFGPVRGFALPGPDAWTALTLQHGRLVTRDSAAAVAAS